MLLSTDASFAITCKPGFFRCTRHPAGSLFSHVAFAYRPRFSLRRARSRGADRRFLHDSPGAGAASFAFDGHRGAAAGTRPAADACCRRRRALHAHTLDPPGSCRRYARRSRRCARFRADAPVTAATVDFRVSACPRSSRGAAHNRRAQPAVASGAQCTQQPNPNARGSRSGNEHCRFARAIDCALRGKRYDHHCDAKAR